MSSNGDLLASETTPGQKAELVLTAFSERDLAKTKTARKMIWSLGAHGVAFLALLLAPLWYADEELPPVDYIHVLISSPPPPPPPPLPKGSSAAKEKPPEKTGQEKPPDPDVIVEPQLPEDPKPIEPEKGIVNQLGSETGSDNGNALGMEGGKEGGIVGGTIGGTVGGVIGGWGDGDVPVTDYDQPPKLLKQTRPQYPQDAFIKKIEGVVELAVVIETDGKIRRARVVRSVPLLDAAAIQTVKQWVFSPGMKHGQPVPTPANIPVTFRIF